WMTDHRGTHIYTNVTIDSRDYVRGRGGGIFSIQVTGGTVDSISQWVSHMPVFETGEEAFLFLSNDNQLIGGSQGKLRIQEDRVHGAGAGMDTESFRARIQAIVERRDRPARDLEKSVPSLQEIPHQMNVMPAKETLGIGGFDPRDAGQRIQEIQDPTVFGEPASTQGSQAILEEDFEESFPGAGWTVTHSRGYTEAYWGKANHRSHGGSWSAWCAAAGSDAGVQGGNYPADMRTWMAFGPFDLSDATSADLQFHLWNNTETDPDYFFWGASIDESSYYGYSTSGNSDGWQSVNFDLTEVYELGNLAGRSRVWIAFLFVSDGSVQHEGTYVDDIVLRKTTAGEDDPVIHGFTPDKASAGTGTRVTIFGSNFGNTRGGGKVEFFKKTGEPRLAASIFTWSDERIVCGIPSGASSGSVYVTTDAGSSTLAPYGISFGYSGFKWSGSAPQVYYRIHENSGAVNDEKSQIQVAAETWNQAGSHFSLHYGGSSTAAVSSSNFINEILWGDTNPQTIAVTSIWYNNITGRINECDMVFNHTLNWSDNGAPGTYDIQTIALHEFGHYLSLSDLYGDVEDEVNDLDKIMYGFGVPGQIKRNLHADDVAGIQSIYGTVAFAALSVFPVIYDAPAGGGTSPVVEVTSSGDAITYTVSNDADWLTISSSGGTTPGSFTLTAAENNTDSTRSAAVTVTATSPAGTTGSPSMIAVTQHPLPVDTSIITPISPEIVHAGDEFWVDIRVGDPTAVTNLFAVSFVLNYTQTENLDYVSAEAGPFLGTDLVFLPTPDDPNGKVNIGISRKDPAGGVDGGGVIMRVKFRALSTAPDGTQIVFSLTDITAMDPGGSPIPLAPDTITTRISVPAVLLVSPTDWSAPAAGGTSPVVNVTSSGTAITYSVSTDADWITILQPEGTTPDFFAMAAAANNTGSTRTAEVTVTATSPAGTTGSPRAISVTQGHDTGVMDPGDLLPESYALYQNHPNPFNPVTKIRYDIPNGGEVRLSVFDLMGRQVTTLVERHQEAGAYVVLFDAGELSSGLYYYRLQTKETVLTRKLMLIR
ncbi:MAG TPA: T9SS type A sorting domain-containing protein, partial [bacterium]|nr:T9SS type A sorting domain-containing protein [bacterium]